MASVRKWSSGGNHVGFCAVVEIHWHDRTDPMVSDNYHTQTACRRARGLSCAYGDPVGSEPIDCEDCIAMTIKKREVANDD